MKIVAAIFLLINLLAFSSEKDYLSSHVKGIDLENYREESFIYLDDQTQSKVFFSGEYHGFEENYKIRFQLIKYFYEEHGIRRYLGELGYSSGYFLNKYLETGEEKYLNIVNYSLEGSYDFSKDDYEFWKALYSYNKELPKGEKIKVYGLDMDLQYWIPVLAVNDLLEKLDIDKVDPEDREAMQSAKTLFKEVSDVILPPEMDSKDIYKNMRRVVKEGKLRHRKKEVVDAFKISRLNFILERTMAEKYYSQEELVDIEAIIHNALNTLEFLDFRASEEISFHMRERFIFENFIRLFKAFPHDEFYGQWGRFHISGREGSSEIRFAQLVEDFAPNFYKNITAIEFVYNDKTHPDYKKKRVREKLKILSKYIPENSGAAIFDLRKLPKESKVLDRSERRYIKYIIIINSPTAAEKLNK